METDICQSNAPKGASRSGSVSCSRKLKYVSLRNTHPTACTRRRNGAIVASLKQHVAPLTDTIAAPRDSLRLAIPSKGRMAEDTLQLLKDCQMSVHKPNPRQYTATIAKLPELEVWFQRATDVVRKLLRGDVDIGIVGNDMYQEIADQSPDLVVVHNALNFGHCHLGLGIPTLGRFADINTLDDLRSMSDWTADRPLQVVTGYTKIAERFFATHGFEYVAFSNADGALEAGPLMGTADIILDLVSTGVTLRENNLKEIEGGRILESEGILVANKRSLKDPRLIAIVRELIERFEAHLKADRYFSVVANMRGESAEAVAAKVNAHPVLSGLQGPTIAEVFPSKAGLENGSRPQRLFSVTVCVPQKTLYESINDFRQIGGSGVLVLPMTYIFDEEPERWKQLLEKLES